MIWTLSFFFYTTLKEKGHNMFVLMLDPKFKSMYVINTFASHENVTALIPTYDKKILLF
jgi:hypothetical protein